MRRTDAGRPMRRIGIDVGGTNTDAALLEGDHVVHSVKTPTTRDVTSGITRALSEILAGSGASAEGIGAVMIGTTHFTNAVVQRRDLIPVAAVRIGLPAAATLEPFIDWPADLARLVRGRIFLLRGGHEVDGRPIVPFDRAAMREAARGIRASALGSVGITSVFSPLNPTCEEEAAAILREECPDVAVTLSHSLGRIGLLARENVTLLNACLVDLARRTTRAFTAALAESGIRAPLYLTQNDGTVMLAEYAESFPVYSFASGPTNSMRGAAFLSGLSDAIVIDVGGTTTDIGCLRQGFPREANNVIHVGGVRTLFRMPDLLSLGLGGGTLVDTHDPTVRTALARIYAMIEEGVDRMKSDASELPLIAVGGGAFLIPHRVPGISKVVSVPHQTVANAVGAAIAQVSGEVDQIFTDLNRDDAIAAARRLAETRAASAGANPATLEVVEVEDLPLAYLPGNSLRVRVRVVGDIADLR